MARKNTTSEAAGVSGLNLKALETQTDRDVLAKYEPDPDRLSFVADQLSASKDWGMDSVVRVSADMLARMVDVLRGMSA